MGIILGAIVGLLVTQTINIFVIILKLDDIISILLDDEE